ncbi:hypothetical protein AB0A77_17030 [Streptomyces varsoviensis]|uniref:hypothetical protein n=1 Tax=Streptomyces varsoviensis TaxID=67373 RepID=UPI00340151A8
MGEDHSGSHGGGTYKVTDGVLKDYANQKIPQFEQGLSANPEYAKLGDYAPTGGGTHLALGSPDQFLAAKNLQTRFGTFASDLHARLESAVQLMGKFSEQLNHVDLALDDAEKDAENISASELADDLTAILRGGGTGGTV